MLLGVDGISGVIEIPAFLQVSDTLQVEERELYHSITYLMTLATDHSHQTVKHLSSSCKAPFRPFSWTLANWEFLLGDHCSFLLPFLVEASHKNEKLEQWLLS